MQVLMEEKDELYYSMFHALSGNSRMQTNKSHIFLMYKNTETLL